ncbi:MAG: CAP domain-containing protein [Pyrinomonadaceae bacterium]
MIKSTLLILAILFITSGAAAAQAQIGFDQLSLASASARFYPGSASAAAPVSTAAAGYERAAFELINKRRAEQGDEPLVWSDMAAAVARVHSADMANGRFFSHRGSDGTMVDDRAERFGIRDWQAISENIAFVQGEADPVVRAVDLWMDSAAHRKNLLDKRWKESAIGVAVLPDGTIYFTQVFILRF